MEAASATEYATLAPLVTQHAESGDPIARDMMQTAGKQISHIIRALIGRGVDKIALIGGVSQAVSKFIPAEFAQYLVPPQGDSVAGGILLAKRSFEQKRKRA